MPRTRPSPEARLVTSTPGGRDRSPALLYGTAHLAFRSVDRQAAWRRRLARDPRPALLASSDPAVVAASRVDLLDERVDLRALWTLPEVTRRLHRQGPDGGWTYTGTRAFGEAVAYDQLATYSELLSLVEQHRLDRRHAAVAAGAEYLLRSQTGEGEILGMYGSQHSTTYTSLIGAILGDAGYRADRRVQRLHKWLLDNRQHDGGWVIALRAARPSLGFRAAVSLEWPVEADRSLPSSHLVTGLALRALVVDPRRRRTKAVRAAAELLASRLFTADRYSDRRSAAYWTKLTYPFHWTDVVSTLDSLALAGMTDTHPKVAAAVAWIAEQQRSDGSWASAYSSGRNPRADEWVTFGTARALRRLLRD
jgi:hypothetical protein